jgi:hypothetical protein
MWAPLLDDQFGLMKAFSDGIMKAARSDPFLLPNLHTAESVIATSDYSGQHKASLFEAYAFLFVNPAGWPKWEMRRQEIRRFHRAGERRLSFKKLGDAIKQRMLPDFLAAVNALPGLCVCVLIDKAIPSLFCLEGRLDFSTPELTPYIHYENGVFEKLLRVVHLVSFFLAGLTREGQDVFWFTDEDDIAANDVGIVELTKIWGNVLSHYLRHSLRHLRCGTTKCDNGSLEIEDLAAVPDLVAGALADACNNYRAEGVLPRGDLLIPPPEGVSVKARRIIGWLTEDCWPLRRLVYCLEPDPNSTAIIVKRLNLHGARLFG